MNVNTSTAEGKTSERLTDRNAKQLTADWYLIDWAHVENEVNRLQVRIAKATIKKKME